MLIQVLPMYRQFNPNPAGKYVDDCVIRALCYALKESWDRIFIELDEHQYKPYIPKKKNPS